MSADRLYGEPDAEHLYDDLDTAIEWWWDSCNLEPGDARLPYTLTIQEYTILPPGESGVGKIPSGADMVDRIVERFCEDCGFEEMADDYDNAAVDPTVIAAFDAARAALVACQKFRVADRAVGQVVVTITAVDENLIPTWTVGEWEAL